MEKNEKLEVATFAAGCFWGIEETFRTIKGVKKTVAGYTGGKTANPTYKDVCSDKTGHAEAVQVTFDPKIVSFETLVQAFFAMHDPTTSNRQGPDVGSQYRSTIFYHSKEQKEIAQKTIDALEKSKKFKNKIVTELVAAPKFFDAEYYHQKYYLKRGIAGCRI